MATATTSFGLRQERAQNTQAVVRGQGLFPGITNFAAAVQTGVQDAQNTTKTFSYYAQEEILTLNDRLFLTAAVNAERPDLKRDPKELITFVKDRPGHDRRDAIDCSKIGRELGWEPQETFDTGMRKTVRWYLDNAAWIEEIERKYQLQRLGAA